MEEAQIKQIIERQPLHGSALLVPRCKILLLVCLGFVSFFLAGEGVCVVGSALENGRPIHEIKKQEKMAYVLGNEGNGMEKEIIDICDKFAYNPITTIESLNVAVAGSIMMYHFQGE